ncbi:hypothetical protein BT93_B1455 [Corymbia citriodora subsp. variegata]|nr:hypothetical protein BT93_B1455 [Corymbia citriodora subsp. variegata]
MLDCSPSKSSCSKEMAYWRGEIQIECATIAFGMGIDEPDVEEGEEEGVQIQALFGRGQVQGFFQTRVLMVEAQLLKLCASILMRRNYIISCSSSLREKRMKLVKRKQRGLFCLLFYDLTMYIMVTKNSEECYNVRSF